MFNYRFFLRPGVFLLLVLISAACAPALSVNYSVLPPQASPTSSAPPVAVQPTQPPASQAPLQVRLAVIESRANILWGGNVQSEVRQAQSAEVPVHHGIEMVNTFDGRNRQSYGILYLPDVVNVELFGNTKVFLEEVQPGAGGSADLTLDLDDGHLFVHLNEEKSVRVTVRTPHATIKALTAGAEFDVCRTGQLTCVIVKRGVVEVAAQNRREIVRAGSAGVVLADQPLSPPVCAPVAVVIAWEERYRLFADAPSLREEIAALPQAPCPVGTNGLPLNARVLYRDEFTRPTRGWEQGEIDQFALRYVRYEGGRYYQVHVQGPQAQHLAFVPNRRAYEDVNIDIKTRVESTGSGAFRYGVVFRRSGDEYYAFVIAPLTQTWYFLKSSSNGMELLKYGTEKRIRGLEGQDTLRVETYGSTFLAFINNRFVDWVSDSDYASGEAGLFIDAIDNPDALINFNSIVIWDLPAPVFAPDHGENCFNASDDDGDGWIDQADQDCQSRELLITSSPTPSPVASPLPTNTPRTIRTPTAPPVPTATNRPPATLPPLLPTLPPLLPTLPPLLPTLPPLLPTLLPLPTISLPLPTISLPLLLAPPVGTPTPE